MVKIVSFLWRACRVKFWISKDEWEKYIPWESPFCFRIKDNGQLYVCPFLVVNDKCYCCMYKAARLKRPMKKICEKD